MTDKEILEVVQARIDGKPIEKMWKDGGQGWVPVCKHEEFDFVNEDYRVAEPEPEESGYPRTWEELCQYELKPEKYIEYQMPAIGSGVCSETRYYTPSFVALAKLIMLRDSYNRYVNPSKYGTQYFIGVIKLNGKKSVRGFSGPNIGKKDGRENLHFLQFHTAQLRDTFKENFEDLILKASELLL